MTNFLLEEFGTAPHWAMCCGRITPDAVQAQADADPKLADKIEAVMMVGMGERDREGRLTILRISPATALAIIQTLESPGRPQAAAVRITAPPSISGLRELP